MTSSGDDRVWTGTAECGCEFYGGLVDVAAATESGSNRSTNWFSVEEASAGEHFLFAAGMDILPGSLSGPGRLLMMLHMSPVPGNGDLLRVGETTAIGFSEGAGRVRDVRFHMTLNWEEFEEVDSALLGLYGWNRASHGWDPVSANHACTHHRLCELDIPLGSVDHETYALFAPGRYDTTPPEPVTGFEATPGDSDWCVVLRWVAPADNEGVSIYAIWRNTSPPPTDPSGWDGAVPIRAAIPLPAEPGTPQSLVVEMRSADPDTEYYFAIVSADEADNWSPVTFTETPVRVRIVDDDGDGMRDAWETDHDLDPGLDDSQRDGDRDGLTNLWEHEHDTDPTDSDTDGDGLSDGDETRLGADPLDGGSVPDTASVRVTDQAGLPVPGAEVWLVSGDWKTLRGKTDDEGIVAMCPVGVGSRLEAFLSGRRASLDIGEIRDAYAISLASGPPEEVPGIVVGVVPVSDGIRVTLSSDAPLVSDPEVALWRPGAPSSPVPMTSADGRVWSGDAGFRSDWGVLDVTAVSEIGESRSAAIFEIIGVAEGEGVGFGTSEEDFGLGMWPEDLSGSGSLVVTRVSAPAPASGDGDLGQVGDVWGVALSEGVGLVGEAYMRLSVGEAGGADLTRAEILGWDAAEGWIPVPGTKPLSDHSGLYVRLGTSHTRRSPCSPPASRTTRPRRTRSQASRRGPASRGSATASGRRTFPRGTRWTDA